MMQKNRTGLSLNKHFAALGAAAAAVTGVGMTMQQADAAIVYSGTVNLNIPSTTAGFYLNVVTGVNAATPAGAVGWDLNPWSSTGFQIWTNNAANPAASDGTIIAFPGGTSATLTDNLPLGTTVDGTSTYGRTNGTETTGATAFVPNSNANYFGFRFWNEATNAINFGWGHVGLSATNSSQPRTLIDYAYDDGGASIQVGAQGGATPEPASLGLLALGAVGLLRRRSA